MITPLLLIIGSAVACFLLLLLLTRPARKINHIDQPTARKQHSGAIPLTGGIAVFIIFSGGLFALPITYPIWLILCCAILMITGISDDRKPIKAIYRLIVQVLVSLIMIFGTGIHIHTLGTLPTAQELEIGFWGYPLTIFAIVGLINAYNMIDGIDGLAAGSGALCIVMIFICYHLLGTTPKADFYWQSLLLLGVLLGFLTINLGIVKQHKAFLGDAGSTLIGFILAWFVIQITQDDNSAHSLPPSLAPWLLAVPVIDTLAIMLRRLRKGKSPFEPDRKHLHHILMRMGLSPRQTLLWMFLVSGFLFSFGITVYKIFAGFITGIIFFIFPLIFYYILHNIWKIVRKLRLRRKLD